MIWDNSFILGSGVASYVSGVTGVPDTFIGSRVAFCTVAGYLTSGGVWFAFFLSVRIACVSINVLIGGTYVPLCPFPFPHSLPPLLCLRLAVYPGFECGGGGGLVGQLGVPSNVRC